MNLFTVWSLIRQAWALRAEAFVEIQILPAGLWIALLVVLLAGLSEELAQSIVLFINRVRPRRFVLTLLVSALIHLVGYLFWSLSVWLVATYLFDFDRPLRVVALVVGLAYAPQIFAFFSLVPYFGIIFSTALYAWSMVAIVVAVHTGLGLLLWQAILCSALGWLLIQAGKRTLGRPIQRLAAWVEQRAAGVRLELTMEDVPRLRLKPRFLPLPSARPLGEPTVPYPKTLPDLPGRLGKEG